MAAVMAEVVKVSMDIIILRQSSGDDIGVDRPDNNQQNNQAMDEDDDSDEVRLRNARAMKKTQTIYCTIHRSIRGAPFWRSKTFLKQSKETTAGTSNK